MDRLPVVIAEVPADWIPQAACLLAFLNPDSSPETIQYRLEVILADHPHYRLWGASVNGELRGLAGAWLGTKIWCGRYLEIDNLVVHPESRSLGIGSALIRHLEEMAREQQCNVLTLDSYTANRSSHRLYHRLGFEVWGFHFIREVGDYTGDSMA